MSKKKSITDFEDAIDLAKDNFAKQSRHLLNTIKTNPSIDDVRNEVNELNGKATRFFHLFQRSLNEYFTGTYEVDQNILNSKIDDSINVSYSIVNYHRLVHSISEKYLFEPPIPAEMAYSSIQRFIKTHAPDEVSALKEKFSQYNLSIESFNSKKPHVVNKKQILYGIIVGTLFLVVLLVIALTGDGCPTEFQSRIFTPILALAGAGFASALPGFIEIRYRNWITATGSLAVFCVIFFSKPADLSDFKDCDGNADNRQKNLSGIVYYDNTPIESIEVKLLDQNQTTNTNQFGKFSFPFNFGAVDSSLKIQLKNPNIQLDTVIRIDKVALKPSIELHVEKYCVVCTHKNSDGKLTNRRKKCSSSESYISKYAKGFTDSGNEQNLTTNCTYGK
ncbi:hypothetical protein GTQ34_13905 [Muricauda sp. JGD-17]|uniref:Uncharacterized protein n=1 Tax=Flagellimonas ochracea TaxID=2696472 RepID=A0A964TEW7_9FLAO|nr:hypothetical protein [Allomuricauda ochracea]NAY93014.1 hypothetical protein [Allomuricauda ochracea]